MGLPFEAFAQAGRSAVLSARPTSVALDGSRMGRSGRMRVAGGGELRGPAWTADSGAARCMLSVAQESIAEMPNKIPGTSAWLGSFLQIGSGRAALRKAPRLRVKKAG